jgi:hypothetical protein
MHPVTSHRHTTSEPWTAALTASCAAAGVELTGEEYDARTAAGS